MNVFPVNKYEYEYLYPHSWKKEEKLKKKNGQKENCSHFSYVSIKEIPRLTDEFEFRVRCVYLYVYLQSTYRYYYTREFYYFSFIKIREILWAVVGNFFCIFLYLDSYAFFRKEIEKSTITGSSKNKYHGLGFPSKWIKIRGTRIQLYVYSSNYNAKLRIRSTPLVLNYEYRYACVSCKVRPHYF